MSKKIKLFYASSEITSRSFVIMVNPTITCEELLQIISNKQKKTHISIFFGEKQLKSNDNIKDYWEKDPNSLFYATTTNNPPNSELMQQMMEFRKPAIKPPEPKPDQPKLPQDIKRLDPLDKSIHICIDHDPNPTLCYPIYFVEPKPSEGKFLFFFTGSTKDHLLKGIQIDLDISMNFLNCHKKLKEELIKNNVFIKNMELLVYLPGGIPFVSGHLSDIYSAKFDDNFSSQKVIYGVLTGQISDSILNEKCYELCNASDEKHRSFVSPLCVSSERGLSDICCLLSYFNRSGFYSDVLLSIFAYIIHFPPLITCLKRIIDNNQVLVRDVVTVCSSLFTYIRCHLSSSKIENDKVFEHLFNFCALFLNFIKLDGILPISLIDMNSSNKNTKFLSDLNLGPSVYLWMPDFNENFTFKDIYLDYFYCIEKDKDQIAYYKPIKPLSIRVFPECAVVEGKEQEFFYLGPSLSKSHKDQNMVDIIDPLKCITRTVNIDEFAKEQMNESDIACIDSHVVKQIVMINLEESRLMRNDFDDNLITPNSDKEDCLTIATQYITSFVNRLYGYHIPCIQGLVLFNDKVKLQCPLTPNLTDFEDKLSKNFQPQSTSKLFDSIVFSCDEIMKIISNERNKIRYKDASLRILVISRGNDDNSTAKIEEVVQKLIKCKIIVDCIIFNKDDDCRLLCALCHATGGIAYRPENAKEGLSFIEQTVFLQYSERKSQYMPIIPGDRSTIPSRLKLDQITEDFMNKAKEYSDFDSTIRSLVLEKATNEYVRFRTPLSVCANNQEINVNSRLRRLLKEIDLAARINDPNSDIYDPDIKIFCYINRIDFWRVLLKGPDGTPYENKWWYLFVEFSDLYPRQPPSFRFITVPYHLNVSSDGKICIDSLEKGYLSSKHVIDIIHEIKNLFLCQSFETPIHVECYDLFINNRCEFEKLARKSAQLNAKDDFHEYVKNMIGDLPSDFTLPKEDHAPQFLISQISGKVIKKANLIMASSGVYYDKDELKRLVESKKNPVCVITGKILTEKFEDI
ncbi:hypothetical protein M9Y10_045920 [Tritrichomonas musculus]|uniref:UBC core domain-containing protein n=1 Tax=Tritrichomonas musculus TaxID=1915356 RepID=A0ABR2JWW6_9EUKA